MEVVETFEEGFLALTGYKPLAWQKRLFLDMFASNVPEAIDIPTGLGKTSVIPIWLLALSAQAANGSPALPRRLVYVVDRRTVVDQATDVTIGIRCRLMADKPCAIVEKICEGLRSLAVDPDLPLAISTLRGQFVDNGDWRADPARPAIIVGTIDMVGSRLLFSGYGVSRKMRPYHAGLLGADALFVLDEAHLVPPFEKLLEAIEIGGNNFGPRAEEDRKIIPLFKLLSLSATGRTRPGEIFRLSDADLDDEIVKKRLEAKKTIEFVAASKQNLEDVLADQAWRLADGGSANIRCLIYCDSRETAENTKKKIEALAKGDKSKGIAKVEVRTELFVGARRVKERDDAKDWLVRHGFLAGSDAPRERPAFLIATSAGEVGVDIDADHVVCDLVPWERMVQRLGRVNRRGDGNARVIIIDEGEPKPKRPDDLTPKEKRQIISYRALAVVNELPKDSVGFDVSTGALRDLKLRAERDNDLRTRIDNATTPAPLRPGLSRALVDAWSMTSLVEHTGRPEIEPWLRGWIEDDKPQTTLVWRKYLPVRIEGGSASKIEIEDFFEAAPPHTSEKLETETYRVVEWLVARASAALKAKDRSTEQGNEPDVEEFEKSDLEQKASPSPKPLGEDDIVVFALTPALDRRKIYELRDFAEDDDGKKVKERLNRELAGATLVIDARLRGLRSGLLDTTNNEVPSTADGAGNWLDSLTDGSPVVRFHFYPPAAAGAKKRNAREAYAFVTRRSLEGEDLEVIPIETWTTEESRAASRNPQLLTDHQSLAERTAFAIADSVGLSGDNKAAMAIAARLHDEGKKAKRWQLAFNAPRDGGIYAKTTGPINQVLLDGYRHEFGSLEAVAKDEGFAALPKNLQDLVLHLVAAHHGYARPIIATTGCEDAPPSALEERARDVALRFARLQKRWGPWGLAWWETLLRAADQKASRDNDARDDARLADGRDGEDA
jgi:CRISPR-associated endonuclease/helicase Cas3